jgi:hypothetical protein
MSPDIRTYDDVAAELGEKIARKLLRFSYHSSNNGQPYWEAERLDELVQMLELQRGEA